MAHDYRIQLAARPTDRVIQGTARGEVARMDAVCFPHDDPVDLAGTWWWIVWRGKLAVGYAGMRPQGYGVTYLCRAGVLPEHRGRNLQAKLIGARVRYARRQGLKTAITDTVSWNFSSANNLIRSGFTLYWPEWRWAGDDKLYWWLSL